MVKVTNISQEAAQAFLRESRFGHLAYAKDNQPYIVPINFAYDGENIYFQTTDGVKTRILSSNPKVCLQVERIDSHEEWESVMVTGVAGLLSSKREIEHAANYFSGRESPPEMNKVSLSDRVSGTNSVSVYRIRPKTITGRKRGDEATEKEASSK